MFSKSRPAKPDTPAEAPEPQSPKARFSSETGVATDESAAGNPTDEPEAGTLTDGPEADAVPRQAEPRCKASVLAADLTLTGTIKTSGDVVVEGTVEGDIQAFKVVLGEKSTLRGEVVADDLTVCGHVNGQLSGLRIYLTSTARVSGDIAHQILAIDAGAQFDGSVKHREHKSTIEGAAPPSGQSPTDAPRTKSQTT